MFASNITDDQIKTIFKLCNNSNISQTELNIILKKNNVTSIIHLSDLQANNIINELYVDYPKQLQEIQTNSTDSTKIRINEKNNIKNIIYNPMTGEQILENDSTKTKLLKPKYSKLKFPVKSDINKKNNYIFIGAGPSLTDNFKRIDIYNEKSSYQNRAFNIGIYAPLSKGLDLGINLDYPFFLRSLIGVALSGKEQKIGFSENSNSKITIRYYILSASLIHFLNEFNSGTYLYTNLGLIKRTGYKSYWWNLGTILTLGIGQAFKFKTFTILPGIDYNKSFDSFLNIKVSFLF
ncbi:MAG: hypothetical protein CMG07_04620 [Candidatus Marinimicrobia bacterium]|nr:hypothetical protein [Candidatus Neomarinimicrobiota bacterium]